MSVLEPLETAPLPTLLELPLEIRLMIYSYLLPYCKASNSRRGLKTVWHRGSINLLAICKQIHDETTSLIYGRGLFELDVGYGGVIFQFRRQLASGLVPRETPVFPDFFSERNLRKMRRVLVNVDHIDSYTGMIKYNCGGSGLTTGLKEQVAHVVGILSQAEELQYLHVNLRDWNRNIEGVYAAHAILVPFGTLRNVKGELKVTGDVQPEFAEWLWKATKAEEETYGALRCAKTCRISHG